MNQRGFSLIGLVGALSIMAVLIAFILLELDPAEKIDQAKDSKRQQDVLTLAYALDDYMKNNTSLPDGIELTTDKSVLCTSAAQLDCADDADIDCLVLNREGEFLTKYLEDLPVDPDKTDTNDSGYYLQLDANNKIVVGSCSVSVSADEEITYVTQASAAPASAPWSCSGAGGYEHGSHCWFLANARNKNCNTVCSDFGLTCEASVTPSDWATCTVFQNLSPGGTTCMTSCYIYTGATDYVYWPGFYDNGTATYYPKYCYVDVNKVMNCANTPNSSYRQVCPCVQS